MFEGGAMSSIARKPNFSSVDNSPFSAENLLIRVSTDPQASVMRKIKRVMRMITFLMLTVCISAAANSVSQTITLKVKDMSIISVFDEIKAQTGYGVFYKKQLVKNTPPISITVEDVPLSAFMHLLLKDLDIQSHIESKTIILSRSERKRDLVNRNTPTKVIEVADIRMEATAPQATIEGIIKNDAGQSLENVSVKVKGSRKGTTTDAGGRFSLTNVDDNATLEISIVGHKSITIKLGKSASNTLVANATNSAQADAVTVVNGGLAITLTESVDDLSEVVISTGIVNRKAESYTGSATTISGDGLRRMGNQNIFQSLKSIDPSVFIMDNFSMGSDPNSLPNMNMRGGSSFDESMGDPNLKGNYQNKPNQPLFILDGFEASVERIFDLDMNLVESLTVLKDAAAKAMYGSKAANGVIIIETKKLKGNQSRITYTGSLDLTMPDLSSYNLANSLEKLDLEFREDVYPNTDPAALIRYNALRKQVLEGLNTDWLSKPVRMGVGHKHALGIDIGGEELRNSIHLSTYDNQGVMKGSERKTLSGVFNTQYRVAKIRFSNSLNLTSNKASDSPYGSFGTYTTLNNYLSPYDANGNVLPLLANGARNPINDALIPTSLTSKYFDFVNNFEAEYTFNTELKLRTRISINKKNNSADRYYPATHSLFATISTANAQRKGQYEVNYGIRDGLAADMNLNYAKTINDDHNIFINGGVNIAQNKFREEIHYTEGFPSANMNDIMFASSYNSDKMRPSGITGFTREFGMLSMFSYTYQDRLLFDATFRLNASSVFGTEKRFAPFWSVGLGWNLHKEAFWDNILNNPSAIKQLKIRGSIGSTGNQNFLSNKSLTINKYYLEDRYTSQIGSYAANMENPDLKWESKMDYNAGLDAEIFGLNMRFDIYRAVTQNLVTSVSSAPSTGFANVSDNLGKVENKGIELNLSYTIFRTKNGFLNLSGAYTKNKNTILQISDAMRTFNNKQLALLNDREKNTTTAPNSYPVILYYDGLPMNSIWAVPSYGIDPTTGLELLQGRDGYSTYIWKAGDMVPSGVSEPKWRGNFGFNGEYKGVGISAAFTYLGGGQLYNTTMVNKVENILIGTNFDRRALTDRWMNVGQEAQFKRMAGRSTYDMRNGIYFYQADGWAQEPTRATQRFVQNRNDLSLSSLSVYYDFNDKMLQNIGIESMKFSAFMNDVFTLSTIGIERGTNYPFARAVSFKLSVTF